MCEITMLYRKNNTVSQLRRMILTNITFSPNYTRQESFTVTI